MTKEKKQKIAELRQAWKNHYLNKYMDMWIRNFEAEGLTEEESDFILKSFWFQGCAAAIRFEGGVLGYVPVAPQDWNVYNFPTAGVPVNNRGVPYIRQTVLRNAVIQNSEVGREEPEIVIGYARPSRKPVYESIQLLVDDLVTIQMTKRTTRLLQKIPYYLRVTPENEKKMKQALEDVFDDAEFVAMGSGDIDALSSQPTPNSTKMDEVWGDFKETTREILTSLGIDNVAEKAERLQGDEINANNAEINLNADAITKGISKWCEDVSKAFGTHISLKPRRTETKSLYEGGEEKEDDADGSKGDDSGRAE